MSSSFVAPLTPVVKKYLDIQAGPSGNHGISSNPVQKQPSRPSSRANNKVTEAGQRPASSALSRPPARPPTDDSAPGTRKRPAAHDLPSAVDARAPRQRTLSQMQRDPPPRNLHINTQPSSTAQRCVVPTSATARPVVQRPVPGVAQIMPARNASSLTTGPQRPPSAQMKFNPPPDRLKVSGNGAKRVPLPTVPTNGQSNEKVVATAISTNRAGSNVDDARSKLPGRSVEPTGPGKLTVGRKAHEGPRLASVSTKPASRSALATAAVVQRPSKPSVKDKTSNPTGAVPQRRPAGNVQKITRPLVKAERKATSPTLIPLPPSPSTSPAEIPLPPSPDCTPHPADPENRDEPVVQSLSGSTDPAGKQSRSAQPCQEQGDIGPPSTPITTLLASIQRGFLFTPSSPLSPPQNYLPAPGNLPGKRRDVIVASEFTKGPLARAPFCIPLQDDPADGLDRHALKDLN